MAFRVEITEQAERDILDILDWLIAEQAGKSGLRWFEGLERAINSLAEMPLRCPIIPERALFPFEARHLLYGNSPHIFRVVFMVQQETVYIQHVWHGHRRRRDELQ